ncbi:sensor histidine kinase [Dongshaea marina]|uniref:sensor histidine kinase n=1 Tax=Dongshaea marina TaxID=2047966 RepID=UPI000D3EC431|nr:ATP-binding protein [Dongshaea marina]
MRVRYPKTGSRRTTHRISIVSLMSRLIVLSMSLLGLIFLLLTIFQVNSGISRLKQDSIHHARSDILRNMDLFFHDRISMLQNFAGLSLVTQGLMNPAQELNTTVQILSELEFHGKQHVFSLLDTSGKLLYSNNPHPVYLSDPKLAKLLRGEKRQLIDLVMLEKGYGWILAVPVKHSQQILGALVIEMPLYFFTRVLDKMSELNVQQLSLFHKEKLLHSFGAKSTPPSKLSNSLHIHGADLFFEVDTTELYSARNHLLIGLIIAGWLLTLLFAFITHYYATRYICRPIELLKNAIIQIQSGSGSGKRLKTNYKVTEIYQLAHSFNRMVRAIKQREITLKEQNMALEKLNGDYQQSQDQLLQSEKMASLGVLSAGIAHEINNPLSFIKSNLNTVNGYHHLFLKLVNFCYQHQHEADLPQQLPKMMQDLDDQDMAFVLQDLKPLMTESLEGVERVQEIIEGLRSFSRSDKSEVFRVDINQLLESTLRMVWNELKYHCQIHKELLELPPVNGCQGKLKQVFLNLLVNAAQAIDGKGDIFVRSRRDGDFVVVEIEDTGQGMSNETLARLFTPFFTTKPIGKGTGLGLSISHGIVEEHGGKIGVESTLGTGSVFSVWLPVSEQQQSRAS